jgi:NAD+ synthase (glutamine-hydrolysing)
MKHHGFVRVAAATPKIRLADVNYNVGVIGELIDGAVKFQAKVLVLPELCLTGYTCGDLFTHDTLLNTAKEGLDAIVEDTKGKDLLVFLGLPLAVEGKIYNVVAAISRGKILGFTTKSILPDCGEFYEKRYFNPGPNIPTEIKYKGKDIPFGPGLLFQADAMKEFIITAEISDDIYAPTPTSVQAAMEGATLIVNSSADSESIGKESRRREMIQMQSNRLLSGYINSNAGEGESTTDLVYGGGSFIFEAGKMLKEGKKYQSGIIYTEIDIWRLVSERRRDSFYQVAKEKALPLIPFKVQLSGVKLSRTFERNPFVPQEKEDRNMRCEAVLMIQTMGLKQRLEETGAQTAVVGISGGLDSTLALLVVARAFALLNKAKRDIIAVTMPGFGTTERTHKNAVLLAKKLGTSLREIPINNAVHMHFADIGHDSKKQDEVFERSQARERNQILLDIAAGNKGLVVGTVDMSELALGWLTFGGNNVAMYGVNVSVPKTLIRFLVQFFAEYISDQELKLVLQDILMTPISSELLPSGEGNTSLRTERIIGPYELHDFFLYYMLRYRYSPEKIYNIAVNAFAGKYSANAIVDWMKVFYTRFFSHQYKRNCMPEGPKIGEVSLSPRGDMRMPTDASVNAWVDSLEEFTEVTDEKEWFSEFDNVSLS